MSNTLQNRSIARSVIENDAPANGLPRGIECLLAVAGLILLGPILLVCAVLVGLSSPGPIFFRQTRIGRYGKPFTLLKFRTMVVSKAGLLVTAATDHRITRIGRILRKWKLDELPEIYNVLIGEMSFVGPRPEVPELVDFGDPAWARVLMARPGITDPVTLSLRNEEAVIATVEDKEAFYREIIQPYKLRGYLAYLETKSLRTDLGIVARTAKVILLPHSAAPKVEKIHLSFIE